MARKHEYFVRFLGQLYYDAEHLLRSLEAHNVGFLGEDKYMELDYTREEFLEVLNNKRVILPNNDRLEWVQLMPLERSRVITFKTSKWGYKAANEQVYFEDGIIQFMYNNRIDAPFWFNIGTNWGWEAVLVYSKESLKTWLHRKWKRAQVNEYGASADEVYEKITGDTSYKSHTKLRFYRCRVKDPTQVVKGVFTS